MPSRRLEEGGGAAHVPVKATHNSEKKKTELYSGRDYATGLGLSPLIGDPIAHYSFIHSWAGASEGDKAGTVDENVVLPGSCCSRR
jgi:hypothetical protein